MPDVSKLRVFGCLAYAHLDGKKLTKLSPRAVPCVYLGNNPDGDGFRLWNWITDKIIISRSVEFFEGCSGFSVPEAKGYIKELDPDLLWVPSSTEDESEEVASTSDSMSSIDDNVIPVIAQGGARQPGGVVQQGGAVQPNSAVVPSANVQPSVVVQSVVQTQGGFGGTSARFVSQPPAGSKSDSESDIESDPGGHNTASSSTSHLRVTRRHSRRSAKLAPVFKGQAPPTANVGKSGPAITKTVLRSSNKNTLQTALFAKDMDYDLMVANEEGLVATLTGKLPAHIERFKQAMMDELQALEDLSVYEKVVVPSNTHVIGVKWVLKEKKATSLAPAKLKARLVARGFTQTLGINYEETHAPVARTSSMRILLAVCAANK